MRQTNRWAVALALAVAVLIAATGCTKEAVVPDVSKLSFEQAKAVLEAKNLKAAVRARLPNDTIPKDAVASQEPPAGSQVKEGTEVGLNISTGPEGITLPDFRGRESAIAKTELQQLGLQFKITKVIDPSRPGTVVNQSPAAGTTVLSDQLIDLTVAEAAPAPLPEEATGSTGTTGNTTPKPSNPSTSRKKTTGLIVAIDAGHQGQGDSSLEPIGPGSSTKKPKVTSGAAGSVTRQLESALNLSVSMKLKQLFEAQGVKVVMVRTSQDVNISNSARAQIANDAGADLFIRVHADSGSSSSSGIKLLVPNKNQWTSGFYEDSLRAANKVQPLLVQATGFPDDGIVERGDMSGFNWSKVPTILVEMGFMSNPGEDRALANPAVQDKIAEALMKGSMAYLRAR